MRAVSPICARILAFHRIAFPAEIDHLSGRAEAHHAPRRVCLSFNCTPPAQLELVTHQIKVDPEDQWVNPFDEFLGAAEDIRHYYRQLSEIDFENTLLRKWVVESLMAVARVHSALVVRPPEGTEGHIYDVDESYVG